MSGAKEPNVHSETVVALKAKNVGNEMSPCKDNYSNGEKGGFEVKSEIYTNNYIFSIQSSSILYHPFVNAGCV